MNVMESKNDETTVLMVTIGYPPDQVGGTEVYVCGLVEALKAQGYRCHVAYVDVFEDAAGPDVEVARHTHEGTAVHVVRVNRAYHKLEHVWIDATARARVLWAFDGVVAEVRPDLVHVHPLVLGFDSYLIERLKRQGRRVVLTYHSSTTGCARGDLVRFGRTVCDGRIVQGRCTACLYHSRGVPRGAARLLGRVPLPLAGAGRRAAAGVAFACKVRSFFSIPLMIEETARAWDRATGHADAVVAVCNWVRDVLLVNGVPAEKITLARHGLRIRDGAARVRRDPGVVTFGYLGRISPEKGIGVLADALEKMPRELPFRFEFCSATFRRANPRPEEQGLVSRVRRLAASDPRVGILEGVANDQLADVLVGWDALVVPSLWFESGPQVVYEAFCVRTPVVGSNLGGIPELVEHGRTGFLVPPGDARALREELLACVREPARLRSLRQNIPEVRTTDDVAADMHRVYARVLGASRPALTANAVPRGESCTA